MNIDRCICYNRTFKSIQEESILKNIYSLSGIKKIMNICNKCCMCNPYLEEMLKTKQTKFNRIIT